MYKTFITQRYEEWKKAIDCVAILDCVMTLTVYGQSQNQMCFPEIVDSVTDGGPIIKIEDGYHPCMMLSEDFVPNSIQLGGQNTAPMAGRPAQIW